MRKAREVMTVSPYNLHSITQYVRLVTTVSDLRDRL